MPKRTGHSSTIGLVYLDRAAEGTQPVERFVASYRKFDAGVQHQLITIYKGHGRDLRTRSQALFDGIQGKAIDVNDDFTDIDSYLVAAEQFEDIDLFCFLNTFSEIRCNEWLLHLCNALEQENVGIAGATGSYESLLNDARLYSKLIFLCSLNLIAFDGRIYEEYKPVIRDQCPYWIHSNTTIGLLKGLTLHPKSVPKWLRGLELRFRLRGTSPDAKFEHFWKELTSAGGVYNWLNGYPPFPNPHIRSNAFIVRRSDLQGWFAAKMSGKNESYLFESGAGSLTRTLLDKRRRAVVVNNIGDIFDVPDWPKSKTFRIENQQGLIVKDNRTREFEQLSRPQKSVYTGFTWGAKGGYEFHNFGIQFRP
jgi:hypothetical protein